MNYNSTFEEDVNIERRREINKKKPLIQEDEGLFGFKRIYLGCTLEA